VTSAVSFTFIDVYIVQSHELVFIKFYKVKYSTHMRLVRDAIVLVVTQTFLFGETAAH